MRFIIVLWLFGFMGCAAALVPATADPNKKLSDAYFLMDHGRVLPAEKLIGEALETWTQRDDKVNIARAHSAFGDLYKDGKTQGDFKLPNYPKALENYVAAVATYTFLKMPKWASLNMWPIAVIQNAQGDRTTACATLTSAKKVYLTSTDANSATEPFEKAGAFNLKTLEREISNFNCKRAR